MKKIARNKLNAIFKKSGFLTLEKISMIFKDDFFIIYNTYTPNLGQHNLLRNHYTFLSISLHFSYLSVPPLSTLNEQVFLEYCSFELKLRFLFNYLYRETSYQRTFIQLPKIDKSISIAKSLQFAQKAVIMNKNQRFTLQGETMNKNHRTTKEEQL